MTTSGAVSYSVSEQNIIEAAMFDAGAQGVGETISDADYQFCRRKLNMLVKQWMGTLDFAPGLKMHSRKRGELFLSTTTGQYSLGPSGSGWASSFVTLTTTAAAALGASSILVSSITGVSNGDNIGVRLASGAVQWTTVNGAPSGSTINLTATLTGATTSGDVAWTYGTTLQARRPLQILTAVLRDSQNNDTPLYVYNLKDYERLPSKTNTSNTGDPTTIYYEAQLTNGQLYTDVAAAADTTKHIHTVYLSPIEDFVSQTDTPDYPQEWYRALVYALAVEICPGFQLPITDELKLLLSDSLKMARESNPETSSMFFQPKEDNYQPWGTL